MINRLPRKLDRQRLLENLLLFLLFSIPLFFLGLTGWRGLDFDQVMTGIYSVPASDQYIIKEVLALVAAAAIFGLCLGSRVCFSRELLPVLAALVLTGLMVYKNVNREYAGKALILLMLAAAIMTVTAMVRDRDRAILALTISAALTGLYGITQYYGYEFVQFKSVPLTAGIGNKNLLAEFLLAALPFTVYWIRTKDRYRIWGVLAAGLILYTLYICRTRAALLGLLVIICLYPLVYARDRRTWLVWLVILLVALAFLWTAVPVFRTVFQTERGTNLVRLLIWQSTANAVRENVLGAGLGAFSLEYPHYALPRERSLSSHLRVDHCHNDLLEFALECGLPLLILVLGALTMYIVRGVRRRRPGMGERGRTEITGAAVLSLAGIGVPALFGFPLHQLPALMIAAFSLGLLSETHDMNDALPPAVLTRTAAAGTLLLLLCFSPVIAEITDYRGLYFEDQGRMDAAAVEFSKLVSLNPYNEVYHYRYANLLKKINGAGNRETSAEHFRRNIELFPSNSRNRGNLAESYRDAGRPAAAAVEFRRVYQLDRSWDYGIINLCQIYNSLALTEQSLALLGDARLRGFNHVKRYENLGFAWFQRKDYRRSAEAYELALLINPTPDNYKNLAVVHIYAGEMSRAAALLTAGLERFPGDELLQNNLTQLKSLVR